MTGTVSTFAPLADELCPADELSPECLLHRLIEDEVQPVIESLDDTQQCVVSGRMVQCAQCLLLDYLKRLELSFPLCVRADMTRDERCRLTRNYQEARKTAVLVYDALDSALRT